MYLFATGVTGIAYTDKHIANKLFASTGDVWWTCTQILLATCL